MVGVIDKHERTRLLEAFRMEIASGERFGITIVDNVVTLRKTIDDHLVNYTFVLVEIDQNIPHCENCGEDLRGRKQHKTKQTTKLCVGKQEREITLCYECYCPQ